MLRSWCTTAAILVALLLACPLGADLEVTVPPGSPLDWGMGYPQPELTGLGEVPITGGRRRPPSGEEGSVETVRRPEPRFSAPASIFDFSGITTVDLPTELPWTRPEVTTASNVEITSSGRTAGPKLEYPATPSDHMHWLAMATLLRIVMHPAQVSRQGVIEHLIMLGEPARRAALRAKQGPGMNKIADEVLRRVGTPPGARPQLIKRKRPYDSMIFRLAWVELASGTPYEPGIPFADKLRWLEHEGAPAVEAYSQSKNAVMRRNAATILAQYPMASAMARLRALISDGDDVVCNRAIAGVAQRRDRMAVAQLKRLLGGSKLGLQVQAADALGRIGDPSAAAAIMAWWGKNADKHDVWFAAAPALARLAPDDAAIRRKISRLIDGVKRSPQALEPDGSEKSSYKVVADNADPMSRTAACWQQAMIALAACGDDDARVWLFEQFDTGALGGRQGVDKDKQRFNQLMAEMRQVQQQYMQNRSDRALLAKLRKLQTEYSQLLRRRPDLVRGMRRMGPEGIVLKRLIPPCRYIAVDALAPMGKPGHKLIKAIVDDRAESVRLRSYAFDKLVLAGHVSRAEQKDILANYANDASDKAAIRVKAMLRLERLDAGRARNAAQSMVQRYASASVASLPSLSYWEVIEGVKLLGRMGELDAAALRPLIKKANDELIEAERQRKQAQQQNANRRLYQAQKTYRLPPTLETFLTEAGRAAAGRPQAEKAALQKLLTDVLGDPQAQGRPHAAIALGAINNRESQDTLIEMLDDGDPFVRMMAYRALRTAQAGLGDKGEADWIWGSARQRSAARLAWEAWAKTR